MEELIEALKNDPGSVDKIKREIEQKGLDGKARDFEKKYSGKINDFIAQMNERGELSREEKAKMVLEMKKKLSPDQQAQFGSVLEAVKGYLKKK